MIKGTRIKVFDLSDQNKVIQIKLGYPKTDNNHTHPSEAELLKMAQCLVDFEMNYQRQQFAGLGPACISSLASLGRQGQVKMVFKGADQVEAQQTIVKFEPKADSADVKPIGRLKV